MDRLPLESVQVFIYNFEKTPVHGNNLKSVIGKFGARALYTKQGSMIRETFDNMYWVDVTNTLKAKFPHISSVVRETGLQLLCNMRDDNEMG